MPQWCLHVTVEVYLENNWWWNRGFKPKFEIVIRINNSLSEFSTRSMREYSINRYYKIVEAPKSLIRNIFLNLLGLSLHGNQANRCVTSILLSSDDPPLLLDYRSLNEENIDSKGIEWVNTLMKSYYKSMKDGMGKNFTYQWQYPLKSWGIEFHRKCQKVLQFHAVKLWPTFQKNCP